MVFNTEVMFEQANAPEPRSGIVDWMLRAVIAAAFVVFGMEKFPSGPESEWVKLFQEIGTGQWFRYFTGVVELLGGVLVLIPQTVTAGLAVLACTMAGAVFVHVLVRGHPADSIIAGGFLIGLIAFWLNRRNH
jgi:uncharacterized membrane protein YphA (DoxX/SURF4 family)